jgi:hypothetical protein
LRVWHVAILLACAACVGDPRLPPGPACVKDQECPAGQTCTNGYCFGAPSIQFSAELFAPEGRTDMLAHAEIPALAIDQTGTTDIMFGKSIEVSGRILLRSDDQKSVAAKVVFHRPSRIPGAPDYVVTVNAASGLTMNQVGYSARIVPNAGDEKYDVTVYPDDGTLDAVPPGHQPPSALAPPCVISGAHFTTDTPLFDITCDRGGLRALTGYVVDALNHGVAGMRVRAYSRDGAASTPQLVSSTASTDNDGSYTLYLPQVRVGKFDLHVDPGPGIAAPSVVRLDVTPSNVAAMAPAPGTPYTVDLIRLPSYPKMLSYALPVSAVDNAGARMWAKGAVVRLSTTLAASLKDTVTYTTETSVDTNGNANAPLIPGTLSENRMYQATVLPRANETSAADWAEMILVGPPAGTDDFGGVLAPIRLASRRLVTGTVRDNQGKMAAGVTVHAQLSADFAAALSADDAERLTALALPEVTTAANGTFSMYLDSELVGEPASYDLELVPPNNSALPRWSRDGVAVTPGTDKLDLGDLKLPASTRVSGVVRDVNSNPVADAEVRVYMRTDAQPSRLRTVAKSGADGTVVLVLPSP